MISDEQLMFKANWVWKETLRIHRSAPETRIASSLSSVEIFVALYYGGILNFDAKEPLSESRDRCVISKGHGSICMYPILADLGFFPEVELSRVCKPGGFLGGIPDPVIPGYETVNGSLGHGLGVATGLAFALKRKKLNNSVFVVVGDGELHEGANWEAIMFASHNALDNLHVIVDDNKISMLGFTDDIVSHGSLRERFEVFGWETEETNGHEVAAVRSILANQKQMRHGKPKALLARTIKGRGVPGLENVALAHILNPKKELLDDLLDGGETE